MFRKVCTALLGVLAMLLAAELLLRALPVSTATMTGYYLDPVISSYPPGHAWQVNLKGTLNVARAGFAQLAALEGQQSRVRGSGRFCARSPGNRLDWRQLCRGRHA